jgi:intein/homing endonuclease
MARRPKKGVVHSSSKGDRDNEKAHSRLHPETKKSIGIVVFLGFAIIFILAAVGRAGPVGGAIYNFLDRFLGWGYYLLPVVFFLMAFAFTAPERKKLLSTTVLGGLVFIFSGLGFIDIVSPGNGGLIGAIIGSLKRPFGQPVALIIALTILIASFLAIINRPLRVPKFKKPTEPEISGVETARPVAVGTVSPAAPPKVLYGGQAETKEKKEEGEPASIPHVFPPLSLLNANVEKPTIGDLRANANVIKRTLESFGLLVEMGEINVGPTITRYTLKPAEGIKLSRITALNQDLALALAAHPIRIEAPIPGKSLVGVEVPNRAGALVRLGSLLRYPEFQKSDVLTFALGRDVSGEPIFTSIDKMPHLLIAGATGSGKTCDAGTYIFSGKGMLSFQEILSLPLNSQKDFQINVATRDGVEMTSKTYNNGICDFYRLETKEGYHIEITAEHPLWVINNDGGMEWRQGAQIKSGDYVAIKRGAALFGPRCVLDFKPSTHKTNKARLIKTPAEMTPELGLFLGLLTADGGLTVKRKVVYTQADSGLLRLYQKLLKNLFGIVRPIAKKSGQSNAAEDIIVHSAALKDFLSYLGMPAVGARDKEIPKFIRMAEPEVIKAFFRGFVRNDGHLGTNSLEISLTSFKLLEQMQIMLLNFGVVSSLKLKKVKSYPDRQYWRLAIYGEELINYSKKIGFLTEAERVKAKRITALKRNINKNVISNISASLKKLGIAYLTRFAALTNNGWRYKAGFLVPKYAFSSLRSYSSGDRNPSYHALQKIMEFYTPLREQMEYQRLQTIAEQNFYWAEVAKISRTRGEGYDFEVPGSNSFVGNGFINHNSIAIHSLIISLLYKNSPETLRFTLIDPKRVELSVYDGLPHLVTPVITDNKKAIGALRWVIEKMEDRYQALLEAGARDIKAYNQRATKPLPYILIIIDELADLMTSYGREVEGAIIRLAQMSRATGIHLVVSTQRPSVEVITGLIKANITSRIALQVASQVDSRTILDTAGADKLLGNGDLLFVSAELSKPRRIQSAYVTEEEIKKVATFIRENNKIVSEGEVNFESAKEIEAANGIAISGDDDELYEEAVMVVRAAKKASASLLQRRLKVGYARAARLLDMMEERGVIGPGEGAKPREVY